MTRFIFNLVVAYLAERFIIKPEPTSAEVVLRWRMALFMHDAADAFRPIARHVEDLAGEFLRLAEGMPDEEGA